MPSVTIGASYGDALLAAEGAGIVAPRTSWFQPDRIVTPDPAHADAYDETYALYRELYPATREIQHALAEVELRAERAGQPPVTADPVSGLS